MTTSDAIALAALAVSVYTIISSELNSRKSDKEQKVIKDEQDRIRRLLLDKETKLALEEKRADLNANLVKIGTGKYRLKIFNKGKAAAKDVRIEFPDNDGEEFLIMSEIEQKMPYEILYSQQMIELIASIHMGSKPKYKIRLLWHDDYNKMNKQDIVVSI
ncbi:MULTISPECIES: hypothetical protein [Klebsiella]|mgnify:CR=1 FL=1|jgi:hypothetical protein|uniref:Uncharacterized protein n=1 Tax=Klebsiella variicola TaxID=244366 RepID=A0A7H4N434_KLEVA|nr:MULTISPECIES: hypothetical protein [Klebsiella]MCS5794614.1 hypothetical protein [Klebsiella pneumoniae subsp. pneumoniae]HBR1319306.1 hypothetical protein [Klebsiella quasipneumoniae subsp. quasipneumoniae]HCI6538236.1 hypothetical protein [Klebsiella variicola subsp. variicola]MBC5043709.1 hypothetical protein [Klebsiella pneumoniae]MBC5075417.1 hypothetical protein [Klebsiella pneumoniae]